MEHEDLFGDSITEISGNVAHMGDWNGDSKDTVMLMRYPGLMINVDTRLLIAR